ncbi:YigZ family protein [Clostridia bacterium]|nr:YigZ family protein [Clostridia bacterium]
MELYRTVKKEASDEFAEKRSRFIGYCKPVAAEEDALAFIQKIKSKHHDATHNVYAYCLRNGMTKRYSDDGEPQGTAGIPTLDVLVKSELSDAVVVVTRYFGGTMLGAGGLVRAYSHGAKIAVAASGIVAMQLACVCRITCRYDQYGKISALIPACGGVIDSTIFTDNVTVDMHVAKAQMEFFESTLTESTGGSIAAEKISEKFYEFFENKQDF